MKGLTAAIAAAMFIFVPVNLDGINTVDAGYKSYGSSSYSSKSYGSKSYSSGSSKKSYSSGSSSKKSYSSGSSKSNYSSSKVRSSKTFKNTVGNKRYTTNQLRKRRNTYFNNNKTFRNNYQRYGDWGWQQPAFGGFNTGFLMAMMMTDNPGEMMFWHSVTGDPWVATFLANAKEEAKEKGDKEALEQIKEVEQTVENSEGSDVSTEEALQKADVPAEVAFHEDALTKEDKPNVAIVFLVIVVGTVAVFGLGFLMLRLFV